MAGKLYRPTIIIDGVAGSGKSTLAKFIARETGSTVIKCINEISGDGYA